MARFHLDFFSIILFTQGLRRGLMYFATQLGSGFSLSFRGRLAPTAFSLHAFRSYLFRHCFYINKLYADEGFLSTGFP